jgi:type IV pilus assembly protein PilM
MQSKWFRILHALKPGRSSLGIEISDDSIQMTQVTMRRGKAPMLQTFISEKLHEQVMLEGRIQDPMRLTQALQVMAAKLDSIPKYVHLAFPSQLVMVRFLKLPDINEKDLAKLVDFEIKHNIHLPFENPLFDFIKLNGTETKKRKVKKLPRLSPNDETKNASFLEAAAAKEGQSGGLFADFEQEESGKDAFQCDVMLVAAPKDIIEQYMEILQAAGLKLSSIEIKALSLYRLLNSTSLIPLQGTYLVVDVNGTASDLSIFRGSELKITRSIPLNFTDKQMASEESPEDTLFAEFMDRDVEFRQTCNDLAHELERLMNFYRYTLNNREHEFDAVVLSGDVERISEILSALAERLSVPIHLFQTAIGFGEDPMFNRAFPAYAVTLGLALRGADS